MENEDIFGILRTIRSTPNPDKSSIAKAQELLLCSQDFSGNIELAEYLIEKGEYGLAIQHAEVAYRVGPSNLRAVYCLINTLENLGREASAFGILSKFLDSSLATPLEEEIVSLIIILAADPSAWNVHQSLPAKLRDSVKRALSNHPLSDICRNRIRCVMPGENLNIAEKIRFLQIQSLALGSSKSIENWVYNFIQHSTPEQDYLIYQLLSGIGEFPDWFKPFVRDHQDLGRYCLTQCTNKLKQLAKVAIYANAHRTQENSNHYMFGLANLPENENWLRSSAHFKIIADYCFYITEIDKSAFITLLLTNELSENKSISHHARWQYVRDAEKLNQGLRIHYPGIDLTRVRVRALPCNLSDGSEYFSESFKAIADINPQIIIWFGGVLESVIFPSVLNDYFPNIYRQFSKGNRPRCAFNLGLTYSDSPPCSLPDMNWEKIGATFSDLPQEGNIDHELEEIIRQGFNIITVGGDINRRMDDTFIQGMCEILKQNSHVQWILVGMMDVSKFLERNTMLKELLAQGRIVCLGFVNCLGKILDYVKIFAYPRQSGGAGGMALASIRGIPVLTFSGGDAEVLYDASDLFDNHDDYFKELRLLVNSQASREKLGLKYINSFNGDQYLLQTQKLMNTCESVIAAFRKQ